MGILGTGGKEPAGRWVARPKRLVPANGAQHGVLGLVTQSGVLLTLMEGEIHGFWATLPRRASTA